ncbi:MAG: tripartite tricarboxylate transporter substrate binding protein [Proteobacteria bacterium]|nr:tripartite tricarboxylate transporter substrate binding protein [Pseudomonadota bacterium]
MKKTFIRGLLAGTFVVAAVAAYTPSIAEAAGTAPKCSTATLVVPWAAGGGTQVIFAIFEKVVQKMDIKSKIKLVMIPGQGGNKGAKEVASAKPDGCTMLAIHESAVTSYLNGRIPYHYNNFETISQLTSTPDIMGGSKNVPWNTFAEFKKGVLAAPGEITVGATFGSTSQFNWLILEDLTGMKFKFVPYDGTSQRMTAILSGAVQLGGLNVASGKKHLQSGALKGFAIAANKRSKTFPDMPTLKELGVDMVYTLDRGIVAPKGTPRPIVDYWADVFKKAASSPEFLTAMDAKDTDVNYLGPDDFRKWADKMYKDHEKVAIKIGMWKKK